ncbi:MAG: recombinase zinc beta ribbon domain-containing protein [Phycisphaeraceae bacterium]|nr:recombinase zinc beta ribbon domain-containing protein [Phycisphaeraceae bacterium]
MLVNPLYTGDMVWNRRTDAKFHQILDGRAVERDQVHGARLVPNDVSDWIVVRDAHPALIDRVLFDQVKKSMDGKVQSIEQRGHDPRTQTQSRSHRHGKTWSGQRSRFILSGLLTCALCGSRYQGFHRIKGRKRGDGTRVKTYSYGCGGYIAKGTSVCQMNPIPQAALESTVIDAVLAFYQPYLEPGGKRRLAEAIRAQLGNQSEDLFVAQQRVQTEQAELDGIIQNLLDNLTAANREFVDQRLTDLRERRDKLKLRNEELECLALAQSSLDSTVNEAMAFLKKLAFTLHEGLPQEKLVALRQCVERAWIDRAKEYVKIAVRRIPTAHSSGVFEVVATLPTPTGVILA